MVARIEFLQLRLADQKTENSFCPAGFGLVQQRQFFNIISVSVLKVSNFAGSIRHYFLILVKT